MMNESTAAKHAALTAAIVAQLEQGVAPWVRPWTLRARSPWPPLGDVQGARRPMTRQNPRTPQTGRNAPKTRF
jgi:antirestriction protein ArdC